MIIHAKKLYNKIVDVIGRVKYQPGYPKWNGIHILNLPKKPGAQPGVTWCNEAANAILVEMGYKTKAFLHKLGIGWTGANAMYDNIDKAVKDPRNGIIEITPMLSRQLANKGYAIFVTARNRKGGAGHVGIVCPSDKPYEPEHGPMIGQAGAVNGIRSAKKSFPGLTEARYFIIPRR